MCLLWLPDLKSANCLISARRNVAVNKTAYQIDSSADAGNAMDGTADDSSCTSTSNVNQPWWAIDLGSEYPVQTVAITGRFS